MLIVGDVIVEYLLLGDVVVKYLLLGDVVVEPEYVEPKSM
jgi:hypothetical protein